MNLQYGRLCKNPKSLPMHLREQFPWYGKPKGVFNIEEHAHPPVRVMLPQRASRLRGNTNQSVGFWLPRFSDGTGTFFPKPSSSYHEVNIQTIISSMKVEQNLLLNSERMFPSLGRYKFENPGSNESSNQGESSHSGTSKVPNIGTGRDSKSSSTQQPSSSKNP
ncbi:hypothetical protein D0Y65_014520 [Glycine soja]|uniref:Uncharacterized protein n=1 Tax=Glycine soja TaxID=3848 RepID=A0A445K8S3_GLYSO|nr:hypothetical protein D0Y65_014520 [Glycine soja]